MGVSDEQRTLRTLIQEAVVMLCRNGVSFHSKLAIEGLLGVTVDDQQVFLINIQHHHQTPEAKPQKQTVKRKLSTDQGYSQKQGRLKTCSPDYESSHYTSTQMKETRMIDKVHNVDKERDCKPYCVDDVVVIDDGELTLSSSASLPQCPGSTKNTPSRQCMNKKQAQTRADPVTDMSHVRFADTGADSVCTNLPIKQEPIALDDCVMESVCDVKLGDTLTMQRSKGSNSTTGIHQPHQGYNSSQFLSNMTWSDPATLPPGKGILSNNLKRSNGDESLQEAATDRQATNSSQSICFDNRSFSFSGESIESQMAVIETAIQSGATEVSLLYSGDQPVRAFYRGFLYTKNRSSGNRIYWRCRDRKCHSRMVTIDGQLNGQVTPHECQYLSRQQAVASALTATLTNPDYLTPNSLNLVQPDNTPIRLTLKTESNLPQGYSEVAAESNTLPDEQFPQS